MRHEHPRIVAGLFTRPRLVRCVNILKGEGLGRLNAPKIFARNGFGQHIIPALKAVNNGEGRDGARCQNERGE